MEIVKGILGAIIPSCQPKDMTYPSDPVFHMKEIGKNMAKKLKRVGVKTIHDLATMTDRDISQATGKTVFISTEKFIEFRKAAIKIVEAYENDRNKDAHIQEVANEMGPNKFGLGDTNGATKEGNGEIEMTEKGNSQ